MKYEWHVQCNVSHALHNFTLSAGLHWYSNTDVPGSFATSALTHVRGKEFQCCIKRTSMLALRTRLYISTDTTGTALYRSKSSPSQKSLQHIVCRHHLQ